MRLDIVWLGANFGFNKVGAYPFMGTTVDDLLRRLRACEAVLSDCDVDSHVLLSKGQSDIVLAMMSQTTMSSDDVGPVTEQILKCRWADPSEKKKTALLKNGGSVAPAVRTRSQAPGLQAFAAVLPAPQRAVLPDGRGGCPAWYTHRPLPTIDES